MRRVALYPGSFDPPTLGHLDIIERGSRLVDHLIVAIGVNSEKQPFLPAEARMEVLRECTKHLDNVEVTSFQGLLVHYAKSRGCQSMIRGLRAVTDFDYEFRIAMANRTLDPTIETVFLLARDEYSFLASSVVKEVGRLGGDLKGFVPPAVEELVLRQFAEEKKR
jgi:pantetheine-phosphate adenylyltransferase